VEGRFVEGRFVVVPNEQQVYLRWLAPSLLNSAGGSPLASTTVTEQLVDAPQAPAPISMEQCSWFSVVLRHCY
jgi:hypothetical protein